MLLKGGGPPAAHATEDAGHGKDKKKKKEKEKGGHGAETLGYAPHRQHPMDLAVDGREWCHE